MKRFFALILLCTMLMQSGGWLALFHFRILAVREFAKSEMRKNGHGLQKMTLSKRDFTYAAVEEDEIIWNHTRYDVCSKREFKNCVALLVVPDEKETSFFSSLENIHKDTGADGITLELLKTLCLVTDGVIEQGRAVMKYSEQMMFVPAGLIIRHAFISHDSPPPEFV